MTMAGDDGFIDIGNVIDEEGNLFAVLVGEAIAGCIGDIDDGGAGGDHCFDDAGEVFVVGAAGVFGIEFDVADQVAGPFNGLYCPLEDLFAGGVKFGFYMRVGGADAGMDAWPAGVLKGLSGDFDIFLDGAAEAADGGVFDDPAYFLDGMEISGAGHREAGFDDIDAQGFELEGELNFFIGVELAARDLFPIAECGVEDENFLVGHIKFYRRFND